MAAGVVLGVLFLTAGQEARAQDARSDAATGSEAAAAPIVPATHPRPTHRAVRATGPITIDGRLDEPDWSAAIPLTTFYQAQPQLGHPASERTDVRVLYDDRALYLACICYDSQPNNLTVTTLNRDFPPGDNDAIAFVFDPNLDRRNGFVISVNAYGAVWDGQAYDDHRVLDSAWEAVLQAATQRTEFGWTMEMRIPWTTLRFKDEEAGEDWGFNVLRRVRRLNEMAYWAPLERYENLPKASRAGTLTGIEGARQGRNLRLKPFVLGSAAPGGGGPEDARDGLKAGADLKYVLNSNLTVDLSYLTDFSHVEVDDLQLDLGRFPLFFPERREFFIENGGIFQFGDGTPRAYRTGVSERDFTLFHSRRVGLTRAGEPIPMLGGVRVSGIEGPFEIGLLAMRTRADGEGGREDYGVVRLRHRVSKDGTLGVLLTHHDPTGPGTEGLRNRAYGVDGTFRIADRLLLASYVATVDAPRLEGDLLDRSAARLSASWRDRFWNATLLFRRFGDDFEPRLGFLRRGGTRHVYATLGAHPAVRRFAIQEANPYVELDYYANLDLVLETRRATAGLDVALTDGSRLSVAYVDLFERLFRPFTIPGSDLTIGTGDYTAREVTLSHQTSAARRVSGDVRIGHGGYFGGTRSLYGAGATLRPSPYFAMSVGLERNEIRLPAGETRADLARLRLTVTPTTRLLGSAVVQYSGLTDRLVANVRLRYTHAPLSDVYLVYWEELDVDGPGATRRRVAIKVTRLFEL